MATTPQQKTIDGHSFTISQLPGMRGLRVFTRLAKLLGGGASGALKAKTPEDQGAALLTLLQNVEDSDVEFIARELLTPCVVRCPDGTGGNAAELFDTLFQGRIDLLFKALVFALQVNYGTFFRGLSAGAAAPVAPAAPTVPSSPAT